MSLSPAMVSAIAALAGSAIGSLAQILTNYVSLVSATRRDLLNRQLSQRESLYSDFISESSRLYAHAMTHKLEEISGLVALYALVSRIRLQASEPVVEAAEEFVRLIVEHYGDPNMTVEEMRAAALSAKVEPLAVFSSACRRELHEILQRGQLSAPIKH